VPDINKSLARFNKNTFHQGFLTEMATINLCELGDSHKVHSWTPQSYNVLITVDEEYNSLKLDSKFGRGVSDILLFSRNREAVIHVKGWHTLQLCFE